jgi:hypothetical protein
LTKGNPDKIRKKFQENPKQAPARAFCFQLMRAQSLEFSKDLSTEGRQSVLFAYRIQ